MPSLLKKDVIKYVMGFYFSSDKKRIVLIEKIMPIWQAGKLNGVGGKVEAGESHKEAMSREFKEETGVNTIPNSWDEVVHYTGKGWHMKVYIAYGDVNKARTIEEEQVGIYEVDNLPKNIMSNLKWLIPIALQTDILPTVIVEKSK